MPARTKRRAKFDFQGRPFVWWVDGDRYLRIASLDKRLVIALLLGTEELNVVEVIGAEFPGIEPAEPRPIWLVGPPLPKTSMGAWVERLLSWSFDESQVRRRVDAPPRFL